jgi:hypothetical protein
MKYPTKSTTPKNQCMECGALIRRPKRFCDDDCHARWNRGSGMKLNYNGVAQVERMRANGV